MTLAQKITDYATKKLSTDTTGTICLLLAYTPESDNETQAFCGKVKGTGNDLANLLVNYKSQLPEFDAIMLTAVLTDQDDDEHSS